MKKIYPSLLRFILIFPLLWGAQVMAQVEKCGSAALHNNMMQTDPNYAQKMVDFENQVLIMQTIMAQRTNSVSIYKIPVVVHVMHKGEPVGSGTNVSDVAIENAIKSLNEIYRKVVGSRGDGNGVDVEIEFALAVRNPSGNCTNGINRVSMTGNSAYMNAGVNSGGTGSGISDATLKGIAFWNKTKYYNIWLVSEIDNNSGNVGIQGYAYFASSHGTAQDGAVMLANNFIGGTSTTCAHELGHALNLYHTFEGDGGGASCPTNPNGCGSGVGDCCTDIPAHIQSASNCVTGTNSCTGTPRDLFIHNYMDYSSDICQNMFTANQKTRMVTAITTTRASFLTPDNGGTNDALTPVAAPTADFFVSGSVLCGAGQTISLIDKSNCVANSYIPASLYPNVTYAWTISNGTTTYTSSVQNPVITIANAGTYSVTLTVTNALGNNTVTKPNAIIVAASGPVTACVPSSANVGNFGQTICDVQFSNINAPSATISNAGYTDLTCTHNTTVTAGLSYNLGITALSINNAENFEVYIDFNNNGVFTNPAELVFSGSNPANSTLSYTTSVAIPTTAVQNTLLRMRVIGESSGTITAAKRSCSSQFVVGDIEDYGVYIKPVACAAPSITATNGASRCGTGTVTINATASAGTVSWYATSSGTTSVATGTAYTTPSVSTTTTYYVDATNSGCTTPSRTAITVTVNAVPVLSLTPTSATICSGGTTTLTASGATTYTWLPSGSGTANVVSPASTTVYTLTGSNGGCASAPKTATVTVNAIPVLTVTPTNTTICSGASTTLTASGATTYTWLPSGSGAANVVSPVSTTVYTVTGSNGSCISTSKTVTVTTGTTPVLTVTPTSTAICSGASTTLTASGATTYTWLPTGSAATNVVSPASTTVYSVSGTTGGCTSAVRTVTVTVTTTPTTGVSASSSTICSGQTATLTATGATTYAWLPGGQSAAAINVNPSANTIYTVTGSNGSCSSATIISVAVSTVPTVTASVTNTTICSGTPVTVNVGGATSYTWSPSGSGTSSVLSPVATTVYSITGANGSCIAAVRTVTINVTTTPTVSVTASSATICAGQTTTTLTATGATTYAWLPGGQTTAAITVNPSTNITYTVTGSNGSCSSSKTISINVNAVPTVTASVTNTTICSGTPVTVNVGGATSYTWSPSGSGTSSVLSPAATTVYSITGSNGSCASAVITVTINVTTMPTTGVTASSSTICSGQTTTLTATGATTYAWLPGGQSTAAINVNPSGTTTYTVTGSNGSCSTSTMITVNVTATPTIATSVTNTTICNGTPVSVSVSGAISYNWLPSGSGSTSVFTPTSTTVYTVTGTFGGCTGTPKTFTINVTPNVALNVSASSTTLCAGQTTTITASGASSYSWQPGSQTTPAITVSPATTTTYSVTGTNGGCSSQVSMMIIVTPTPSIASSITNTTVCSGTPVTVNVTGGTAYVWAPSGSGSSGTFAPVSTTVYTVTSQTACGIASVTFTINVVSAPVLTASAPSTICAGSTTTLNASGATSYAWLPTTGLSGSTGSTVSAFPASSLVYTVTGSNGACEATQTIPVSVVLCVGMEDLAWSSHLAVYPNPSTGLFTISTPGNAGKLDVEVLNTLGQTVVKESSKNPETLSVDLNGYSRGVYYLKVQLSSGTKLVKVVLE